MRRAATATAALIFLVTWGLTTHGKYSVTGDEPHYLMVAESLRSDGDLDLADNYARDDGARFGAAGLQPELHVRRTAAGKSMPVHDIGVPIVLLPVYAAATAFANVPGESTLRRFRMNRGLFAYSLISLSVLLLATLAAVVTMRALAAVGARPSTAAIVVAITWLSPPVISNAFLVFPEPFALFVTACVVAACVGQERAWRWPDSAVIAMLGALPWLHRKFAFYAIALLTVVVWHRAGALRALPRRTQVLIAIAFGLLPAALAIWTLVQWGNLAGPLALDRMPFSLAAFAHGAAGTIVDRENGLLWGAPVYALLPAALWLGRARLWPWLIPVLALAVPSAAHDQWWGGFSPAGRFLVPLIPIFCLVGIELAAHKVLRFAAFALLVPQAIMTAYAWQHPRMLWPQGDGENRVLAILLPPLGAAYRAIPSFRTAPDRSWFAAAVLLLIVLAANLVMIVGYAPSRNRRSP